MAMSGKVSRIEVQTILECNIDLFFKIKCFLQDVKYYILFKILLTIKEIPIKLNFMLTFDLVFLINI
jgi:hypothetical protein